MNRYNDAKPRTSKTSRPPSTIDSKSISSDKTVMDSASNIELESQKSNQNVPGHQASPVNTSGLWTRLRSLDLKPSSQITEDAVMGTSDGMTVPFALTASLVGIVKNARYVMLAGLAELTAGALSMALGGLLQSKCERESYDATVRDTLKNIKESTDYMPTIIDNLYDDYDFSPEYIAATKRELQSKTPETQAAYLVRFHEGRNKPDKGRPYKSAGTLGACYFLAGLIGLFPYILVPPKAVYLALYISIGLESIALLVFGYVKTAINVGWKTAENIRRCGIGAFQMLFVGAVASGVAVGLIMAVNSGQHIAA